MGDGELPNGYFETYAGNHGIWKEHRLDAKAILRTLQGLPDFWAHLRELAATDRILSSVDVGAGEAAKSWPCSSGCSRPWSPWGWSGSCCTPTSLMTTSSRSTARRVAALPAGLQGEGHGQPPAAAFRFARQVAAKGPGAAGSTAKLRHLPAHGLLAGAETRHDPAARRGPGGCRR
jgi:hypothetical protein